MQILIAVLMAVVIHVLFLLLLVWALPHWPKGHLPPKSAPFRLTITKSTPAPPQSLLSSSGKPTPPPYIATQDEQLSATAPDQPAFQSDKDTLAASEKAAAGDKPLPTQEGKEIPAFDFDTRPFRLDKVASSAASAAPASPTSSEAPDKDKAHHPKTKTSTPDSKSKPASQPKPTPDPAGELASLKAQPTPAATPDEFPDASETPPPPEAQPLSHQAVTSPATPSTTTSPGLAKRPGYQPETIQTRMQGAISNRGRASVAALGTPMGRYEKAVSDQVGMRWYYYVAQRADLISVGSVKVHFVIAASGHVHDVKIMSGNANGVLADISVAAITEAEIPAIPAEVAATLDGNQMEVDYDFSEY